jgi:hypothetical protein
MPRYAFAGLKGAANVQGAVTLQEPAAAVQRIRLMYWHISCPAAAPTDTTLSVVIQAITTAPTGALLTPRALDKADTRAATSVATAVITVDPTFTANEYFHREGLYMKLWATYTAYDRLGEYVVPVTNSAGMGFAHAAATTTDLAVSGHFEE